MIYLLDLLVASTGWRRLFVFEVLGPLADHPGSQQGVGKPVDAATGLGENVRASFVGGGKRELRKNHRC